MSCFHRNFWLAISLCLLGLLSTPLGAQAGGLGRTATRLTIEPLQRVTVGKRSSITVHLTDADGNRIGAVANEVLYLFMNGVQERRIRTDDQGSATFVTRDDLPTGIYNIEVVYKGTSSLSPSSASAKLVVVPAELEIHTVPPWPNIRFSLKGRVFTSNKAGVARIKVDTPGSYTLEILEPEQETSDTRIKFSRWADEVFSPHRTVTIPMKGPLEVGFELSHEVSQSFVDLMDKAVDSARVSSLTLKGSHGVVHTFENGEPHWLTSGRVVRRKFGLEETKILYSVITVMVDGSNVVSQAQQRFYVRPKDHWQIQLLFYNANFKAYDALFRFPIGTGILLEYPDGQTRHFSFGPNHDLKLFSLARGQYKATVIGAKGMAPPTPLAVSRDQDVELIVLSQLDMIFFAVLGVSGALGLLFYGRPQIIKMIIGLPGLLFPKRRKKRLRRVLTPAGLNRAVLQQCPTCNMSTYQTRAGRNRSGSQRYRCQTCGHVYTPAPRPLGFSMEVRERALQLYLEGKSRRSIARTLNVSSKTVSRWVVEHRIQFSEISVNEPLEVVPMQEQPASTD